MSANLAPDLTYGTASGALPSLRGASVRIVRGEIACSSEKVRSIYHWWQQAGGGSMPDWGRFDVTEHRPLVPHLFLVKRLAPSSWSFTLKGEAVRELLPSGNMPEAVREMPDPETATRLNAYYEQVAATGLCHLVRGKITNDRGECLDIESIDCPFANSAKGGITILGVMERVRARRPSEL